VQNYQKHEECRARTKEHSDELFEARCRYGDELSAREKTIEKWVSEIRERERKVEERERRMEIMQLGCICFVLFLIIVAVLKTTFIYFVLFLFLVAATQN